MSGVQQHDREGRAQPETKGNKLCFERKPTSHSLQPTSDGLQQKTHHICKRFSFSSSLGVHGSRGRHHNRPGWTWKAPQCWRCQCWMPQVAVRVRPLSEKEIREGGTECVEARVERFLEAISS